MSRWDETTEGAEWKRIWEHGYAAGYRDGWRECGEKAVRASRAAARRVTADAARGRWRAWRIH